MVTEIEMFESTNTNTVNGNKDKLLAVNICLTLIQCLNE